MSGSLRVLEPEEVSLVAGGSMDPWNYPQYSYDTTIIVTGYGYNPWVSTMSYATYMQYYSYYDIAAYYSYGSWYTDGGGTTTSTPAIVDQQSDVEAKAQQSDINNKPDSYQSEYMSLLFKDSSDNVQGQDPVKLQRVGISLWDTTQVYANYDAAGHARSDIVGYVHNHPYDLYASNYAVNRYPTAADWSRAGADVAAGADASLYSLYVIDPYGAMREYQYTDRSYYEGLSDTQKQADVGLPGSM